MVNSYVKFFDNYANFTNKVKRKDFWLAVLANWLVEIIIILFFGICGIFISGIESLSQIMLIITGCYLLVIITPLFSLIIRRLKDTGYAWQCIFLLFVSYPGWLILIILVCLPSKNNKITTNLKSRQNINVDNLAKWYKLLEIGAITQEEYNIKKDQFLK